MESTTSINDQQTPPIIPINNSSSRRKQSKPNRLEHIVSDNCSITPYHVAAEQQDIRFVEDESDRISLNCEDGSLSSHSTNEHYPLTDLIQPTQQSENCSNDFQLNNDETNQHLIHINNRIRSSGNKSRSLKRKHNDNDATLAIPTRIFHADAFCEICKKEFCNKYFLKTHLANKHGIFDHQSVVPTVSTATISSKEINDNNDSNVQHPFTIISSLITNGDQNEHDHDDGDEDDQEEDENSSSTSSDKIQINSHQNQIEFNSFKDDINHLNHENENENDNDNENDNHNEEINSNSLINLPQQIATILSNDNNNSIKIDDDQRVITTNSPTNNFDIQSSTMITPNLSRQTSTKLREDFCDICQKHFCNKYYLRKHKLDVHGVQTDCNIKPYKRIDNNNNTSKTSPTSTQSIAPSSTFSNVTFNPSSVQQSLGILLNPIFSPLVQSSTNNEQQDTLIDKRRHTDSSNESSSSKCQYITSDVANLFTNQFISNNSKSTICTCNLCGKKFQSNDYLQLHLMNKHQIKTDIQQRTTKTSNLIQTSNDYINSNTIKKIKLEPNETITTTVIKASSPIDTISSIQNCSPVISGIVDTYFAAKMADRVSCDICHKQVCNKYFLKTHKLKVHGIGISSTDNNETNDNDDEEEEEEDNNNDQQQSNDNSPPQLIVDEINIEPGVIPSPDSLTASVNTFISSNNDSNDQTSSIICELCSKTFPSKFLLHIHMTNVHGIQQSSNILNGITNKNPINNNGIKKPLTNGNNNNNRLKQTPQVQLRVTCQFCKKELCNKYFLRAHMRNVHNISVDDIRLVQQQPSSTSQSSPNSDNQSSKQIISLSPTDIHLNSIKTSLSNDNEINNNITDSNESENVSSSNENTNQLLSMQPFLVESDDDLYKDLFVPCMVYLPCRHRVTKPLEISLRLKPVDNSSTTNTD